MFDKFRISRKYFICTLFVLVYLAYVELGFCFVGDMGYDSGISVGFAPGKTITDYKEVVFITGEPVEMTGTLTLKKTKKTDAATKSDVVVSIYQYNISSANKDSNLTRTITLSTIYRIKDNGQTIINTEILGKPAETIKIRDKSYVLSGIEYTQTGLIDLKPALEYFSGNFRWKKSYKNSLQAASIGAGASGVTVETTGTFVGVTGYWGSAETVKYKMSIEGENKIDGVSDKWGGMVNVKSSFSKNYNLRYQNNEPTAISFQGGYIQDLERKGVLKYNSKLPEFDKPGASTYTNIEKKNTLKLDAFPITSRLKSVDSSKIRGHWAQKDIDQLLNLEVFNLDVDTFEPDEYVTRGEFVDALVRAAKEVPKDPVFSTVAKQTKSTTRNKNAVEEITIFSDVPSIKPYKNSIEEAYKRDIISGIGNGMFEPDKYISFADAVTVLIRTLGLEQVSRWPGNVTEFKDNNDIPSYARAHIVAGAKIGFIKGDNNGNVRPNEKITRGRAAAILNRLIDFMRNNLISDYTEKISVN